MLARKTCHQGLRPRSRFFGLEPLDVLLLFPGFYVCSVLLQRPFLAVLISAALAIALRLLKLGRLPGHTFSLALYLLHANHTPVLGRDCAPRFPNSRKERP